MELYLNLLKGSKAFKRYKSLLCIALIILFILPAPYKAYAYYSDCDAFAYFISWPYDDINKQLVEPGKSETVLQRHNGGFDKGYIQPGERLMVVSI